MGGSATAGNVTAVAEFNVWCDPEAAAIVFDAACPVWMSGLDLTYQVLVRPPLVERIRGSARPGRHLRGRPVRLLPRRLRRHPLRRAHAHRCTTRARFWR